MQAVSTASFLWPVRLVPAGRLRGFFARPSEAWNK
jgi:hypothetical protein